MELTIHMQVVDYHFGRMRRYLALVDALVVLAGGCYLKPPVVGVLEFDRVPWITGIRLLPHR